MSSLPPFRCVYYLRAERRGHVPTRVEPQFSREAALGAARSRLPADVLRVDVEKAVSVKGYAQHVHWRLLARRAAGRELQEIRVI